MKNDRDYLSHCRETCERILLCAADGKEHFFKDFRTQDAVRRNFQVLGEAAKKVSAETRKRWPEVPWRQMAGIRDRLVHDYFGADLALVWGTATTLIGPLRDRLTEILNSPES